MEYYDSQLVELGEGVASVGLSSLAEDLNVRLEQMELLTEEHLSSGLRDIASGIDSISAVDT